MIELLMIDLDGTCRESLSREKFIQHPQDQQIIAGADKAIARRMQMLPMLSSVHFFWAESWLVRWNSPRYKPKPEKIIINYD